MPDSGAQGSGTAAGGADANERRQRGAAHISKYGGDAAMACGVLLLDLKRTRDKAKKIADAKPGTAVTLDDDGELRREYDALTQENSRLFKIVEGQKDGIVLTADERKVWEQLKALNVDLKTLPKAIEDGKAAQTKLAEQEVEKQRADAAAAVGYNKDILPGFLKAEGLALEMRDGPVVDAATGATVVKPVPHVRSATDDKAAWTPLTTHVESKYASSWLPALKTPAASNGTTSGTSAGATSTGSTVTFPSSAPAGGHGAQASGSAVDQHLRQREEAQKTARNPLMPPSATKQ